VKHNERARRQMVFGRLSLCAAILGAAALLSARSPGMLQAFEWETAAPESQGMSAAALDRLRERLAAANTKALLVIRRDRVVHEWYAADHSVATKHYTASMAKAIVGGVATGLALTDRRIALDDLVAAYVPQWTSDPRKSRITIRQLGSHASGLEDAEAGDLPHGKLTGWKGDYWKRLDPPRDPFTIAREHTPALFEPGERFQYSNPGIAMLTYALTAAFHRAGQPDVRTLLRDRVMRPIGAADDEWAIGYGQTFTVDGLPLVAAWGGGSYTARAVARVGRLMLHGGSWDGRQILAREAVRLVTTDAGTPGHGAIGWWSNSDGKYPGLPKDAFWGSGAGHQVVLVIPSLDLVAVRNGASLGDAMEHHDMLNASLFAPLVDAITRHPQQAAGSPLYPQSPVIGRMVWAPPESTRRAAEGSDNWPLTWADDDALYGAYGDGQGFEPRVPKKLSMGFARITGGPGEFRGANIRSPTGETTGDGQRGKKASGMLMVRGVLYLWVRNAGNAQLAWSPDRGGTWQWSAWTWTPGFGAPTFLNFGRDYSGARDGFVYVYSHDSDSAYVPADRMVLARVPADRIREREAYRFFTALDAKQQPVWTPSIAERGAVFTSAGRCYRSGISYNAGLRRYLWAQTLPGSDARFEGGFGVYDAPEPWGPWTTVFYTDRWDVGPGETSSFPTKWMSPDGTTVHLVFSGNDAFSVRQARLIRR
jgi:CubicO group peptidase (beta-lactamase class C family)